MPWVAGLTGTMAKSLSAHKSTNDPFESFMALPECQGEKLKRALKLSFKYSDIITSTNITDSMLTRMPDNPSPLLPCSWETITFKLAQVELYRPHRYTDDAARIKLIVDFDAEVEVYLDTFSYSLWSFSSNIFGLVGLYIGYCMLDLYNVIEKIVLRHKISSLGLNDGDSRLTKVQTKSSTLIGVLVT